MTATFAYSPSSWCSIIIPESKPEVLLFAPIPKIRSSIVTLFEAMIVVLPLSVMFPKNSASAAEMTYVPPEDT